MWNEFHLWPSIGGLRHLVSHAKKKKFDHVVIRAGGRVLIDEAAFFEWTKSNQQSRSS
jgi:hypothetical protein